MVADHGQNGCLSGYTSKQRRQCSCACTVDNKNTLELQYYIFERSNSIFLQNIRMPCLYWCIAKTALCAFWACQVYLQVRWLYERYSLVRNVYRLLIQRLEDLSHLWKHRRHIRLIWTRHYSTNLTKQTIMFQPIRHKLIWIASHCSW